MELLGENEVTHLVASLDMCNPRSPKLRLLTFVLKVLHQKAL